MENTERSYPFHAHNGELQFVAEKNINEEHAKYFMGKLLEVFNPAPNNVRALFENMIFTACKIPPPTLDPDFSSNTVAELAEIDQYLKLITERFNNSPLVVRDFFTRAILETGGVFLDPPAAVTLPTDKPASKIILLGQ